MALGTVGRVGIFAALAGTGPARRGWTQAVNWIGPNEIVPADESMALFANGFIDAPTLSRNLRLNGVLWEENSPPVPWAYVLDRGTARILNSAALVANDPWMAAIWERWEKYDPATLRTLLNRNWLAPSAADLILQAQGWAHSVERQSLLDLRRIIPAPGQILDMALRGALDPHNLGDDALGAEYSGLYDVWARANGLTTVALGGGAGGNPPIQLDFARALWALHWQLPTMPDYFEMRRRLRPSISNPNVSSDPSGIILPADVGDQIARQNSIHPLWRNALQAIAYVPVSFRHIDLMYQSQQIDATGVEEIFRDHGYAPYYARKVAAARVWKLEKQERAKIVSDARLQIAGAWEIGTISDADYLGYLIDAGETPDQARQSLELARVEHNRKRVDRLIRAIRQQVLTGQISMDQGEATLLGLQIHSDRVADYVQEWSIELSGRRRILSARETLKATEEGLLSVEGMAARLRNLRYNDADINIFAGELQLYIAERLSKAAAQAAKAAEKRQREAERAARLIQQAQRESRDALAKHGSPATLERWYCEGLIGEEEVQARLTYLLWPPADIDRMLAECAVKAAKKHPPKQPPAPVPPN